MIIVDDGRVLYERMRNARVNGGDILTPARLHQGLERLDRLNYAVVERSGGISVVPRRDG